MSASPVVTEPAGLVCICDQQHRRLVITAIGARDSGSPCPLFSHLLSVIVAGGGNGG